MPPLELTPAQLAELNARFASVHPREIIRWAADTFPERLILTSSFGAESMCTIHLAIQARLDIPIVVVNTGYLFPETLAFMEAMRARFGLNVREYHTRHDPIVWLTVHGETDPRLRQDAPACCAANKNEPFDRAMKELAPAAWLRGVRADQSAERKKMEILQWNARNHCWAIAPILRWTSREIYHYMKDHDLPFHPLYEEGYASIGCNPETCTRAISLEDDPRSGRWAGTEKKECGIHFDI